MKKSGKTGPFGSGGTPDENTKYATPDENTKYARPDDNTKYAQPDENTKYARPDDNTKYARVDENTKYARPDENTKYATGDGRLVSRPQALARRRAVDAAIEEALMSAAAAVDRTNPGISTEARADLVGKILDKFGQELLEAHYDVIQSDGADD